MQQPIPLQPKHSYFARECSLSRNNPLHKIKVTSVNENKILYRDLFHGSELRDARPSFFKESLFANSGLYLIQDLGDEDYVEVAIPPVIPEVPVKETFGDVLMKVCLKSNGVKFPNIDHERGDSAMMVKIWSLCLLFAGISFDDPDAFSSRSRGKVSSQFKNYCLTRQVAQYLGTKHTNLSLKSIGYYTGRRDHSTVINSRNEVENYIAKENKFVLEMIDYVRGEMKEFCVHV